MLKQTMIQTKNWGSLPIKMSQMKSRMIPSEERWKDWWNQILKQPKQSRSIMMRSLLHHHASVLAAQYWKRISQERKGGKLDYRWQGPYIITAALGKGLFQLKELNGDKVDSSCASYWNHNIYIYMYVYVYIYICHFCCSTGRESMGFT